jgi:glycerol-1-phosphatase
LVRQDETMGNEGSKILAESFDAFLLDLDGVVYLGDEPLPGSREALARLREAGKKLRFLTNDPRPTREQLRRQLAGMDVDAWRGEVITSGWATARYLAQEGTGSTYLIASRGLASEISFKGKA